MKLLLDTHTFIWLDSKSARLSQHVRNLCQDQNNNLILSIVSVWEIQIKVQLGRLKLDLPLVELVKSQQTTNQIEVLPIRLEHALELDRLPLHHKDPFDRLLVAQANIEDAVLLSKDKAFAKYSVRTVW